MDELDNDEPLTCAAALPDLDQIIAFETTLPAALPEEGLRIAARLFFAENELDMQAHVVAGIVELLEGERDPRESDASLRESLEQEKEALEAVEARVEALHGEAHRAGYMSLMEHGAGGRAVSAAVWRDLTREAVELKAACKADASAVTTAQLRRVLHGAIGVAAEADHGHAVSTTIYARKVLRRKR